MYVTKRYVFKKNISHHNLFRSFTIDVGILKEIEMINNLFL